MFTRYSSAYPMLELISLLRETSKRRPREMKGPSSRGAVIRSTNHRIPKLKRCVPRAHVAERGSQIYVCAFEAEMLTCVWSGGSEARANPFARGNPVVGTTSQTHYCWNSASEPKKQCTSNQYTESSNETSN